MTESSLNQTMDRAVQHYSSLFVLPSYKCVITLQTIICVIGGVLATGTLFPSFDGLINGLILGLFLLLLNSLLDCVVSILVLHEDPLFDFRRTAAVSMICMGFWFAFVFIGVGLAKAFSIQSWVRLCLLGFSAVMILRLVTFNSTSRVSLARRLAASLLQPFLCLIPFLVIWTRIGYPLSIQIPMFAASATAIGLSASLLFLSLLNRVGKESMGIPSFLLLKAFLLNWVLGLSAPLEQLFERLSEEKDVEISLIRFGSSVPRAVIAIPSVHPGPFKNLGSSTLPSVLKAALEKKFNCIACVPHGLFGHELDLSSQIQSQKLVDHVIDYADFAASDPKASPFITVSDGKATACCQLFGKFAFISFTLAPETTEDFPKELGCFVRQKAEEHGLVCVGTVNAHNSINGIANIQEALPSLEAVAAKCFDKAASLQRLPFGVGTATLAPREFTLGDGMGPGGITVLVVEAGGQKAAYVVIDGNNMVSGLRNLILSALHSVGIDDGEIFTTDTHAVNALVLNGRGYHPVGEVMNKSKLIGYIKEATQKALSNMERVKDTRCCNVTVPHAKVIGEKQLENLCLLVDKGLQKAKRLAVPVFGGSGLLLMLTLLLLIV